MEHRSMRLIHLDWDGLYKLSELDTITDEEIDYVFTKYTEVTM